MIEELLKRGPLRRRAGADRRRRRWSRARSLRYNAAPVGFSERRRRPRPQTRPAATRSRSPRASATEGRAAAEPIWSNDAFSFRDEYDVGRDPTTFFDREEQADRPPGRRRSRAAWWPRCWRRSEPASAGRRRRSTPSSGADSLPRRGRRWSALLASRGGRATATDVGAGLPRRRDELGARARRGAHGLAVRRRGARSWCATPRPLKGEGDEAARPTSTIPTPGRCARPAGGQARQAQDASGRACSTRAQRVRAEPLKGRALRGARRRSELRRRELRCARTRSRS